MKKGAIGWGITTFSIQKNTTFLMEKTRKWMNYTQKTMTRVIISQLHNQEGTETYNLEAIQRDLPS